MRRDSYSTRKPGLTTIMVYPEDEFTRERGKELAADLGISLSELVWRAVDDYVTLHQHIVPNETRAATLAAEYDRQLKMHGYK